jgi:hypothetical protein
MVIARLLPLFDQFAPDQFLGPAREDGFAHARHARESQAEQQRADDGPRPRRPEPRPHSGDSQTPRHAKTSDERDLVYADAVMDAMRKKDPRVEEFLNKIEDTDLRKRVRAFVDYEAARGPSTRRTRSRP